MVVSFPSPRALALFGFGAAFLVAAEIALRVAHFDYPSADTRTVVWSRARDAELRSGDGLHQLDRWQIWKPRPGARIPWTTSERVNERGLRGPLVPLERTSGVLRIAVIGASTAFGEGVAWDDTFGAQLVRELARRGVRAEVIDAAVMGTTIRQGLERYRRDVRPYRPDVVVSTYSGLNEHLQAPGCISDEERVEHGAGLPSADGARADFAHDVRDGVRVVAAAAWLRDVYFGDWWREREAQLQELRLARTVGTFDSAGVRRVSPPAMRDAVVELAADAQQDHARLLVLTIPHKPGGPLESDVMYYYQRAAEIGCENARIEVVPGRFAYSAGVRAGIPADDLFLDSGESSYCGHALLAEALVEALLATPPSERR